MLPSGPKNHWLLTCFLTSLTLFSLTNPTFAAPLAFPGAEGFGCNATGGRGGTVYHVTNLNDSGPGSFRDAVSQSHRIVVFDVSGIILIKSRIVVADHIMIAGQTAPGDGITIYGDGLSFSSADHSIVRYMRFRMGVNGSKGKDAITIAEGSPMIFDHVSVSWGRDETFSISGENGFFTIQNSIIAQGLDTHSCGGLIQNWGGISILRSLYIDNKTRNPKVKGVNQFINNIIYNWRAAGYILGDSSAESHANILNNYYIAGPESGQSPPFSRGNENFHLFAQQNFYDANINGALDGQALIAADYGIVSWQSQPYDYPPIETIYHPETAYKVILSCAGATLPNRDEVDHFLLNELKSLGKEGKIISDESQLPTQGPGTLNNGKTPQDTDQDGMPDFWEKTFPELNPNQADHNQDTNQNGYTNLEDYLNWLGSWHAVAPKNSYLNIDLHQFTNGFNSDAKYTIDDCSSGAAQLQADGHTIKYQPTRDYTGIDTVSFTVNDGNKMSGKIYILVANSD